MPALTRVLLAAALATGTLAAPAHAARHERAEAVVAVPADGSPAETPFVTGAGALYTLIVTGTYAYDRIGGLADCGHRDTNASATGQIWTPSPSLRVDGATVVCGDYSDAHTYVVRVAGTGSRLRLDIADPTGNADNAGALAVAVVTAVDVEAYCTASGGPAGALVAVAQQSGTESAGTSTEVECTLRGLSGEPLATFDERSEGPGVVLARHYLYWPDVRSLCVAATVYDASGAVIAHRTWPCTAFLL